MQTPRNAFLPFPSWLSAAVSKHTRSTRISDLVAVPGLVSAVTAGPGIVVFISGERLAKAFRREVLDADSHFLEEIRQVGAGMDATRPHIGYARFIRGNDGRLEGAPDARHDRDFGLIGRAALRRWDRGAHEAARAMPGVADEPA